MSLSLAFIEQIAEERIKKALEQGEFDDLPGRGKPLDLDDDAHVPPELKMAWRVLKNAGCLPPELEAEREIHTALELLEAMTDESERYRQMQRLNLMITRLNETRRRPVFMEMEQVYYDKIVARVPVNRTRDR
ncbi:DnaJ family domain-containing protein [Humidesulfovibrio idahonensis]